MCSLDLQVPQQYPEPSCQPWGPQPRDRTIWNVSSKFNALPFPGPSPHRPLLLPAPDDPSSQNTPPGAWGAQHIHMEKSLLRRVQLGHGNEMSLPRDSVQHPAEEHPAGSFTGSPPGSMASLTPHTRKDLKSVSVRKEA